MLTGRICSTLTFSLLEFAVMKGLEFFVQCRYVYDIRQIALEKRPKCNNLSVQTLREGVAGKLMINRP